MWPWAQRGENFFDPELPPIDLEMKTKRKLPYRGINKVVGNKPESDPPVTVKLHPPSLPSPKHGQVEKRWRRSERNLKSRERSLLFKASGETKGMRATRPDMTHIRSARFQWTYNRLKGENELKVPEGRRQAAAANRYINGLVCSLLQPGCVAVRWESKQHMA